MADTDVKSEAPAKPAATPPVKLALPVEKPVPAALAAPAPAKKPATPAVKPASEKPAIVAKAAAPKADPQPKAKKPVVKQLPAPQPVAALAPAPEAAPATKEITMDTNTTDTVNKAQAMFAEGNDRAKAAMQKGQQLFADANDFTKGNVEAMIESSKIAAKGAEDIARYSVDYARQAVAKANENARRFASVKSPTEFLQLQTEIARGTVDAIATEGAKFTENYLKLVGEIVQPLSNRFALAAEKVKIAA